MTKNIPFLKFYVNYEEDLEYTLSRLTHLDPAGIDYRIAQKGLDKEIVLSVLNTQNQEEKKIIFDQYLKSFYEQNKNKLITVAKKYQKIWDEKRDIFFPLITERMGNIDWKHKEYLFLVSSFYSKASWGKSNKMGVWWKREPEKHWYLNGYELILTHFFETVDVLFEKRPVSDIHLWALAEITAYILVYKEPKIIKTLWPNLSEPEKYSYHQLVKPIEDLSSLYKNENYNDYVFNSVEYIKKFSSEFLSKPQ
ncbi:MAG: hypothetical protein MUP45_02405 [Candidatus Marinimicrobia bacterium]|nr:hypothetical protein [Candidatus Neomarinimicrobiota bacterium]